MAKRQKFKKYEVLGKTISPIDLLSRDGGNPFSLSASSREEGGVPWPVKFYATAWSGKWVEEDRGEHGRGSEFRYWSFRGQARIAIGGTVAKIEWSPWIEAKGEFIEGKEGVHLQIRG